MFDGVVFAPPVILLLFGAMALLYVWPQLTQLQRDINEVKAGGDEAFRLRKLRKLLKGAPSAEGDILDGEDLRSALSGLVNYSREVAPDWICGVQPGGRMLSIWLANELGLGSNRVLYIETTGVPKESIDFHNKPNSQPTGNAIVIDDISRTGDTLKAVKSFIRVRRYEGIHNFSQVKYVTLATVLPLDDSSKLFVPDWTARKTNEYNFSFPWTWLTRGMTESRKRSIFDFKAESELLTMYKNIRDDAETAFEVFLSILTNKSRREVRDLALAERRHVQS